MNGKIWGILLTKILYLNDSPELLLGVEGAQTRGSEGGRAGRLAPGTRGRGCGGREDGGQREPEQQHVDQSDASIH